MANIIDNRHAIRDPLGPNANDAVVWANTLAQTRISNLFTSVNGLPGHAQAIQNELNRVKVRRLEGYTGDQVDPLITTVKFVRDFLKKSIEQARSQNFPLPGNILVNFPLIHDSVKI